MIALGWAALKTRPPQGVTALAGPGLTLLAAPATDAHQVLTWQQRCFDAGIDLLPLAPAALCPVDEAAGLAPDRAAKLAARLGQLAGMAQYSLHLQWDEIEAQGSYLTRRAAIHAQAQAARDWLSTVAAPWRATAPSLRGRQATIHLLAPRTLPPAIDTTGAPGQRLTLVGPWPPLAFAA